MGARMPYNKNIKLIKISVNDTAIVYMKVNLIINWVIIEIYLKNINIDGYRIIITKSDLQYMETIWKTAGSSIKLIKNKKVKNEKLK